MTYEVQPTSVRAGHWRLSIAFVALVAVSVVALGVWSRPAVTQAARVAALKGPPILALALPASFDCHGIAGPDCAAAARAAVALVASEGERVARAEVWSSLLCNSTFECPPTLLTPESTPIGSVVLTFDSGPAAWINVVSKPELLFGGTSGDALLAWLVRWR
jgi:hypothetical protein